MATAIPTTEAGLLPETRPAASVRDAWTAPTALVLAAFYFATSIYISRHRLFWIDEIFTILLARLPHVANIWQALARGIDAQPPGYYVTVMLSEKLLGHSEVAARMPSTLALVAGLLVTYDCARRLTNGVHGLIALSLLTCSFLPYYGYEARPYALFFMLSALAFWIWNCTRYDSGWAAVAFGAVLGVAVMMHYYATLCLLPYVLWEAIRWKPWQRPSPKLLAGFIGVVVPAAVLSPLVLSFAREFSATSHVDPSLAGHASPFWTLLSTFSQWFPDGLFLLALLMLLIVLLRGEGKTMEAPPVGGAESLGWLFLTLPLAGYVLAQVKTHAFVPRYFISALPGVAVAFACWTWRCFRDARRLTVAMFGLLAAWGIGQQVMAMRDPEPLKTMQKRTRFFMNLEDSFGSDGKRFIVFPHPPLYLETSYYSKHPSECILLKGYGGFMDPQSVDLARYYPLRFWTLDDLREHAKEAVLIEPRAEVLDALRQAGFQIDERYPKPWEIVYIK